MDPWQPYAVAGDFHFSTNSEWPIGNTYPKINQPAGIDF